MRNFSRIQQACPDSKTGTFNGKFCGMSPSRGSPGGPSNSPRPSKRSCPSDRCRSQCHGGGSKLGHSGRAGGAANRTAIGHRYVSRSFRRRHHSGNRLNCTTFRPPTSGHHTSGRETHVCASSTGVLFASHCDPNRTRRFGDWALPAVAPISSVAIRSSPFTGPFICHRPVRCAIP